jgi:hypothetical protein
MSAKLETAVKFESQPRREYRQARSSRDIEPLGLWNGNYVSAERRRCTDQIGHSQPKSNPSGDRIYQRKRSWAPLRVRWDGVQKHSTVRYARLLPRTGKRRKGHTCQTLLPSQWARSIHLVPTVLGVPFYSGRHRGIFRGRGRQHNLVLSRDRTVALEVASDAYGGLRGHSR